VLLRPLALGSRGLGPLAASLDDAAFAELNLLEVEERAPLVFAS
jgi:hypothetical protein